MSRVFEQDASSIQPYFGDFGGMLIPDSFMPDLLAFAEDARQIVVTDAFETWRRKALEGVAAPVLAHAGEQEGVMLYLAPSRARYYVAAGHLALARVRGTAVVNIGAKSAALARFAAAACSKLGLHGHITLSRSLSSDEALKEELKSYGCALDDTTCVKLYNRPEAYAFQRYIGNRPGSSFIPFGAEVGAYPFPALSGLFGELFGRDLIEQLPSMPDGVAVTMQSGTAAVSVFRALENVGCARITVEEPVCQEFHGEYCGCVTLSVRFSRPTEYHTVICPQLADMWRVAGVRRLGCDNYYQAKAEGGVSAAARRAAHLVRARLPEIRSLLIVEGEHE